MILNEIIKRIETTVKDNFNGLNEFYFVENINKFWVNRKESYAGVGDTVKLGGYLRLLSVKYSENRNTKFESCNNSGTLADFYFRIVFFGTFSDAAANYKVMPYVLAEIVPKLLFRVNDTVTLMSANCDYDNVFRQEVQESVKRREDFFVFSLDFSVKATIVADTCEINICSFENCIT